MTTAPATSSITLPTLPHGHVWWMVWLSRRLLPRRQDVTDVTYVRLSCLVYIIIMHGSFHSRFSRIFLRPYGAGSNSTPIILKWTSVFSIVVCLSPEWRTVPKFSPLAFNSNLNPWRETAITTPLNHLKSSPSLSVVSCPHIPYITCRWWLGSSPVWWYQITGQYTPV